jgi:hypothetical protein
MSIGVIVCASACAMFFKGVLTNKEDINLFFNYDARIRCLSPFKQCMLFYRKLLKTQ